MPAASVRADENADFTQICDPGQISPFTGAVCRPCHHTCRPTFVSLELTLPYLLSFFSHCINGNRLHVTAFIWPGAKMARDAGLSTTVSLLLKSWPIFAGR